jgi:hypothetical protein
MRTQTGVLKLFYSRAGITVPTRISRGKEVDVTSSQSGDYIYALTTDGPILLKKIIPWPFHMPTRSTRKVFERVTDEEIRDIIDKANKGHFDGEDSDEENPIKTGFGVTPINAEPVHTTTTTREKQESSEDDMDTDDESKGEPSEEESAEKHAAKHSDADSVAKSLHSSISHGNVAALKALNNQAAQIHKQMEQHPASFFDTDDDSNEESQEDSD